MKRDMDLVRKILFKMADNDKHSSYSPGHLKVDGYTQQQVDYHLKMMAQADLLHIDTMEQTSYVSKSPEWTTPKVYMSYYSVSWNGHEFLEAARDNTRWEKAKGAMAHAGGFAVDVMKQLLIQYLKEELKLP